MRYSGSLWLWFRTGLLLGIDGKRGNDSGGFDPNDPVGSEAAFYAGRDVGHLIRAAFWHNE